MLRYKLARSVEVRQCLQESQRLHDFLWESEDFQEWMGQQMTLVCSDEFGADYDHVTVSVVILLITPL